MSEPQPLGGKDRVAQATPTGDDARSHQLAIRPWSGMLLAVLGGAIALWLIEALLPVFTIPEELQGTSPYSPPEQIAAKVAATEKADLLNTCTALALIGGLIGGLLAFGEGLARRSVVRAIGGLAAGAVVTAVFGVFGVCAGKLAMDWYGLPDGVTDLLRTYCFQSAMLATLGAGAGLVLGLLGGRVGGLIVATAAGALGGLLAGIVFSFSAGALAGYVLSAVAPQLLVDASTETLLPFGLVNRALWIGWTAVLLGLVIPGLRLQRTRRTGGVTDEAAAK